MDDQQGTEAVRRAVRVPLRSESRRVQGDVSHGVLTCMDCGDVDGPFVFTVAALLCEPCHGIVVALRAAGDQLAAELIEAAKREAGH